MHSAVTTDLSNKFDSTLLNVKILSNAMREGGLSTRHSNSLGNIFLAEEEGAAEQQSSLTKQNLIFLIHHQSVLLYKYFRNTRSQCDSDCLYLLGARQSRVVTELKIELPPTPALSELWTVGEQREDADCGQRTVLSALCSLLTHSRCTD